MKCPESGIIQSYIDGELDIKIRKEVESHLEGCSSCKGLFDELKSNDDFVFEKLTGYKKYNEDVSIHSVKRISPVNETEEHSKERKGAFYFMRKYQKYLATACALVIVATCITVQPVRAVISSTLNIFRVDNLKGIRITPQDINQIKNTLSKGQGDFNLDNIGRIKLSGGETKSVSLDEIKNKCGFPVQLPSGFSGINPELKISEPSSIAFTLDVKNVNTILKSFKSTEVFPEEIDGKTFTANFGAQAEIKYTVDGKSYNIIETTSPKIEVPDGVNVDQLFNTVVNIPILPEELKSKLKSISDWKSTLYIPMVEPVHEVTIRGTTAYICSLDKGNSTLTGSRIIWMDKGVIYGIISNTENNDLINFAKSLR